LPWDPLQILILISSVDGEEFIVEHALRENNTSRVRVVKIVFMIFFLVWLLLYSFIRLNCFLKPVFPEI